ncbi:MAG: EAL domain-containing protein [Gallionella sp.]|jgi:diguanylate cyclase (GGDEF)-like protein/PAS domain S-box-containing protein|nr:EAL domain-containing protein [Gallionella sp.]MCK9354665.1 EAL domain-containing protein [Gallionella sp.]
MTREDKQYLSKQLYVKLTWLTLLVGLLIGFAAALYETFGHYAAEKDGRASEISYLLNASFQTASRAVVTRDKALAEEVTHGIMALPSVYRAVISDERGVVLSDVGRSEFPSGMLASFLFEGEQEYRVALRVSDGSGSPGGQESAGELYVAVDREVIAQQVWGRFLETLVDESLHSLMIALLLSLILYYFVTRPLSHLSARLRQLHPGDMTSVRLEVPVGHGTDEIGMVVGTMNQLISELRYSEEVLRSDADKLRLHAGIFENSHDSIAITDAQGNIESVNPAFSVITGYTSEEVIGKNPRILQSGRQGSEFYETMWKSLLENGFWSGEVWNRRKDGGFYAGWLSISALRDAEGNIEHFIGVTSDNTEYKAAQERIRQMAFYDQLTGLPNRSLLRDRVDRLFAQMRREENSFAIMFIDLDNFKRVNDSLGHHVGDLLLKEVASRLGACVREVDTVSRQGGDEFVVLLPECDSECAQNIAARILSNLSIPHGLEGHEVVATPSIGISMFPRDARDFETLTKHADTALYRVKENGRAGFQFFMPEMNVAARKRLELENQLRKAVENAGFTLHYQPQIDRLHGRVVGMEALIRWNDPLLGNVPPDEFIPVAEENGLIVPIGVWVLREACAQNKRWQEMGLPAVPVSVNVSAVQIHQPDFVRTVADVLESTGLAPKFLDLELTERVVMADVEQSVQIMRELNALGVGLSIDDFGTGYSSLAYLKRFPLRAIKIDKSFVRDLETNADDRTIAKSIILLAHGLNVAVVAEGVENELQLDILREQGCDTVQGYYFSRPLPTEAFAAFFREARTR